MANRRNVLIGLGGLVAAGGAALGTGAFTTVEAQRSVNIQTTGDANAFLAMRPARDDDAFVSNTSNNTIEVNLDGTDSNNGNASGLNKNARTRFEDLVLLANNGTQDVNAVNLSVEETALSDGDDSTDHEEAFKITTEDDSTLDPLSGTPVEILENSDTDPLTPGDTVVFGIEIDLLDSDINEIDSNAAFTLTIEAQTANSNTGN